MVSGFAGWRGLGENEERIPGLPLDSYKKLCYNKMGIKKQGARTKQKSPKQGLFYNYSKVKESPLGFGNSSTFVTWKIGKPNAFSTSSFQ